MWRGGTHMVLRKLTRLAACTAWLACASSWASDGDQLLATLQQDIDRFGRIATDTKQNVDYMPYVVSTLRGDELRTLGVENLRDALQLIPGVDLSVGMAGVRNPIFRGSNPFSFGQSKLIIDGMVVNDQIFGGYNQYLDMPVRLIHRIEVVRGPGSLLNHVNGYAGSIHVITRANRDDGLSADSEAFVSAGSNGYRMVGAVGGGKAGDLEVSADVFALRHDLRSDAMVDRFGRSGNADQSLDNYSIGLNLRQGAWHFKGRFADNDSGVSYGQSFSLTDDPNDRLRVRNAMFDLGYRALIAPGVAADLSLGYLDEVRTLRNKVMPDGSMLMMPPMPPVMLPNGRYFLVDHTERTLRGRAELKVNRIEDHTISLGLLLERTTLDDSIGRTSDDDLASFSTFRLMNTGGRRHLSLYADDLWNIGERLAVQIGLKADRYNDVDSQLSPRVAMVYRHDDENIYKLMYTESYREPSWREQYLNSSMAFFRPNASLEAESVAAYEAAYIHTFGTAQKLKLNLFHLRNDSQIYAANGASTYANHPETRLSGLEVELLTPVGAKGQLSTNYSHVDGENVVGALANSTQNMFKAAYLHRLDDAWSLSGVVSYVGGKGRMPGDVRADVDGYVTLDLAAQYHNRSSGTRVGISVRNALDERYVLPAPPGTYAADFEQPGRSLVLNVAQEF